MPDALIVFASVEEVVPGRPAPRRRRPRKRLTLYQMVDLLAALNSRPYSLPSTLPIVTIDVAEVLLVTRPARSRAASARRASTKSAIVPGCDTVAMSGGLPPSTAVESDGDDVVAARRVLDGRVRVLRREAVDHGLEGLLLGAGPDADHRDRAGDVSLRRLLRRLSPPEPDSSSLPHAPTRSRRASIIPRRVKRWRFMRLLSFRRRCRVPSPGRKSAGRACRLRP